MAGRGPVTDDLPILRVVLQRHEADCAVAVLAMVLGVTYEDALVAVAAEAPQVLHEGTPIAAFKRAARRLGARVSVSGTYDLDASAGVLAVNADSWPMTHLVVLRDGMIVETDGLLWDADVFFRHYRAKPGPLFVVRKG